MKTCGIYTISYKNKVIYVGQSIYIERRFKQYRNRLRANKCHNFILQNIFNKHGDVLQYDLLEEYDKNYLLDFERYWMYLLNPIANIASANGSHLHSKEAKLKMSNYAKNRTEEHKSKLSKSKLGIPSNRKGVVGIFNHTEETKLKIGLHSKGNKYRLGFKHSKETIQKLKILNKNKNAKKVFDIENKVEYISLKEACEILALNYKVASRSLSNKGKYKTLIYYATK